MASLDAGCARDICTPIDLDTMRMGGEIGRRLRATGDLEGAPFVRKVEPTVPVLGQLVDDQE